MTLYQAEGYTFPGQSWPPNPDNYNEMAENILGACGAALDQYGNGADYTRRMIWHGDHPPPYLSKTAIPAQLLLSLTSVELGQAGQQQFQFDNGAIGKYGFRTARFVVTLVREWPRISGGTTGRMPDETKVTEARRKLWQDGYIVFSTLLAISLGGITPAPVNVTNDKMLVGQMQPVNPGAGMAIWRVPFEVMA